jgi:hypothetical protein
MSLKAGTLVVTPSMVERFPQTPLFLCLSIKHNRVRVVKTKTAQANVAKRPISARFTSLHRCFIWLHNGFTAVLQPRFIWAFYDETECVTGAWETLVKRVTTRIN